MKSAAIPEALHIFSKLWKAKIGQKGPKAALYAKTGHSLKFASVWELICTYRNSFLSVLTAEEFLLPFPLALVC